MAGTVGVTFPVEPHGPCKDEHKQEEEGARYLQPENAAHPLKRPQKATDTACYTPCRPSSRAAVCSPGGSGSVQSLRGRCCRIGTCFGSLAAGRDPLARHPPGNPEPDSQRTPDTLRSHFVMMVAAAVPEM